NDRISGIEPPDLWVRPQIADQDHLVDATRHDVTPLVLNFTSWKAVFRSHRKAGLPPSRHLTRSTRPALLPISVAPARPQVICSFFVLASMRSTSKPHSAAPNLIRKAPPPLGSRARRADLDFTVAGSMLPALSSGSS